MHPELTDEKFAPLSFKTIHLLTFKEQSATVPEVTYCNNCYVFFLNK